MTTIPTQSSHFSPMTHTDFGKAYVFDNNWFDARRAAWEVITKPLVHSPLKMLEIGAFEGASTTWMLDNLATHPDSILVSVDTFEGGIDFKVTEMEAFKKYTLEMRFDDNVAKSAQAKKLRKMKMTSEEALLKLRADNQRFDLIYIDGSHVAIDVLTDAVLSWPMLNKNGLMVFDDLHWQMYDHEAYNPGAGILSFLKCASPHAIPTEAAGQVWVQKVAQRFPPVKRANS